MEKLLNKILKRLTTYIPYNRKYRPTGIHSRVTDQGVVYYAIYPPFQSELTFSAELLESCTDYIKTPKIVDVPATYVIEVEGGRVFASTMFVAIIDKFNKIVPEASYHHIGINKADEAKDNPAFKINYFMEPVKYNGTLFSMLSGGGAVVNYGHWLVDALPRIGLLKKSGLFDKVDWFLIPTYKYDYHKETLELLGVPFEKIIVGNEFTHIQADNLIATSNPRYIGHFHKWMGEFLRSSFLDAIVPVKYPPLAYIRRSDSAIRRILNEDELVADLKKYGFVDYELSKLSFIQKVNLFRSADVIVAASGAPLVNYAFCKKEAKVLEIFATNLVSTMFADIATKVGIEYHYVIVDSKAVKNIKEAQNEHFSVDVPKVMNKVDVLMKSTFKV